MKQRSMAAVKGTVSAAVMLLGVAVLLSGCGTFGGAGKVEPERPPGDIVLQPGQKLTVVFSDVPTPPPPFEQTIRGDGKITLPLGVEVVAAGKTTGQLLSEIRAEYVPKYYRRLTVNIREEDRFYFVGGQVRNPSRQIYAGDMTVLKAIQSVGDFTDYAKKKKVKLTRPDGSERVINAIKAEQDPRLDLPVRPGDRIYVPRRFF